MSARPLVAPSELATFTYHDVTDVPGDSGFQRPAAMPYKLGRHAFARHLDAIARAGTPALVPDHDLTRPGRHLLLTFDDGGASARTIAEELERRGWRGHFFVVTSFIGSQRFLSAQDLRALHAAGHLIGSHSHTHPDIFNAQPPARMAEEWRVSGDILAQLLGAPCLTASVPGGDSSRAVFDSAAESDIRFLFTSEPQLRPQQLGGCWALGRYCPNAWTPPERVEELARFRGWRSALFTRRLKGLARAGLPFLYKSYVRVRTR
jgi:peptidoglycan/xylan/chitin deacetylase (PgdA/CDA1 family)